MVVGGGVQGRRRSAQFRLIPFNCQEPKLPRAKEELAAQYQSADFFKTRYDLQIDICRMGISPGGLETVIACDVLERVLTVPHGSDLKVKMELPSEISPADRLRLAGQEDHQRIYREDFVDILSNVAFDNTAIDESHFEERFVRRHYLRPPLYFVASTFYQSPKSLFRSQAVP